jgi:hypothetical protein
MRPLFLLLLAAAVLGAQPVSFGLKGGIPLTDFISAAGNGTSLSAVEHPQRYLLGPAVELKLPWRFAIEADVLYRRVNYQTVAQATCNPAATACLPSTTTGSTSLVTSNDWEFPLLLKYRFPGKMFVRPYVDAGVAFDRLQGLTDPLGALKNPGTTGGVAGAGLDLHVLILHISPEIRYTRWTSQHFNLPNVLASQQNQAEFMVGITF